MFTGIVHTVGELRNRRRSADGVAFTVSGLGAQAISPGDSVAINGVCQTVETVAEGEFRFTAVGETLGRTTLDALRVGSPVNLETAATPETALGGHIVQGHVDGVGEVNSFVRRGRDWLLAVRVPEGLFSAIVPKGSIAIDGISLTVIETRPGGVVTMTIIPFTREQTIARGYRAGTRVNVETDILGKYIVQYLDRVRFGR